MSNSGSGNYPDSGSILAPIPYHLLINVIATLSEGNEEACELAATLASYLPVGVLALLERRAELEHRSPNVRRIR